MTAIAMLAQYNASNLPKGDNSLSKERAETRRKKPEASEEGRSCNFGPKYWQRYSEKKRDL